MKFYDPQHRSDVIRNLENVANTLTARMGTGGGNVPLVLYDISHSKNVIQISREEKKLHTHGKNGDGGNQVPIVNYCLQGSMINRKTENGPQGSGINKDKSFTLNTIGRHAVTDHLSVRRLTPIECERLQGLPDNYTNVAVDGKPASDGARYKAIGNGMAQPCADFIIKQIVYWTEEKDDERRNVHE